jgi:hypothetical protein
MSKTLMLTGPYRYCPDEPQGDHRAVPAVRQRLRPRCRMCVVADRGMISAETVAELEARRLLYILGVRERSDKLVHELVLDHPAPFVPLMMKKRNARAWRSPAGAPGRRRGGS